MSRKPQTGPLQRIRILDLTRLLPGPLGTMLMADMGAEVIKIDKNDCKNFYYKKAVSDSLKRLFCV